MSFNWFWNSPILALTDFEWQFLLLSIPFVVWVISRFMEACRGQRRWRVKSSKKAFSKVRRLKTDQDKIEYLRGLDAFVFEELVLTAFKHHGHRIRRNKRYTGDGGIDGQVWINGRRHLVQAKCYSGYIRKTHLHDFDRLCRKRRCKGLFVHTGILGGGCKSNETKRVSIISGPTLLDML